MNQKKDHDKPLILEKIDLYDGLHAGDPITYFEEKFPNMRDTIAGIPMGIFPIKGKEGEIQGVMLMSLGKEYHAVENEIKKEVELIASSIAEKYGPAPIQQRYPLFIELNVDDPSITHIWELQQKNITISVLRHEKERYNCSITIISAEHNERRIKDEYDSVEESSKKF